MLSGKVPRDCLLWVFFLNNIHSGLSSPISISSKMREDILNSRCTTSANSTSGKLTTSVVYTGDKFTINFKDTVASHISRYLH